MIPGNPVEINLATYNQIAPQFAKLNSEMPPSLVMAGERFLQYLPEGKNYLDLGCGTGRDLSYLGGLGGSGIGADLSTGMLDQARRICKAPLVQMELTSLAFAAGSFSGVWCVATLLHLPKSILPSALREIKRVMAPSGIFFVDVQEGSEEDFETLHTQHGDRQRFFARYTFEEIQHHLIQASFTLLDSGSNLSPGRKWLWFFAWNGNT